MRLGTFQNLKMEGVFMGIRKKRKYIFRKIHEIQGEGVSSAQPSGVRGKTAREELFSRR